MNLDARRNRKFDFEEALKILRRGEIITSLNVEGQYELTEEGVLFDKGILCDSISIVEILGKWC
jgi:hypothetical protein